MTQKQEIVKRLLEAKQITFEESLVLLESQVNYISTPPYTPPCNPYQPPFIVTCKQTH
jgi:hypothetical protein